MAGLEEVSLLPSAELQCRSAALVYSAEGKLAHQIPQNWNCFKPIALQGGQQGNIAIGNYGVGAVDAFIDDGGEQSCLRQ